MRERERGMAGMYCRVWMSPSQLWARQLADGRVDVVSYESDHDLALMVNDFVENGNSSGADSRYSSDSDPSLSELVHLAEKISYSMLMMDQFETDMISVVNSLAISIKERELHFTNTGLCNASCIRFSLVKLLRVSGYDAGVCTSQWQKFGKIPGGDHEYIDIVRISDTGDSERLIIDVDFRSHFEIARAVDSYDRILKSLPVIYVGSFSKLKQFLQVMVEAAKSSLKQNSMPLPPWRSFSYLLAKWKSPYIRSFDLEQQECNAFPAEHKKCAAHLRRLHSSLKSTIKLNKMVQ